METERATSGSATRVRPHAGGAGWAKAGRGAQPRRAEAGERALDPLKERVLAYQRTGQGGAELLAELSMRAYLFAGRRRGASEDDPGEFLLFVHPRLQRLLERYRDTGAPFDHYLNSVLAWNLKSYLRRSRAAQRCWDAGAVLDFWPEAPEEDGAAEAAGRVPREMFELSRPADRKRLLLLVLRNVWYLGVTGLDAAARAVAVPSSWLAERAETLRRSLGRRAERLRRLRERRDAAYGRMRLLQERAARALDGQDRRRLDAAVAREEASWRRACALMRRVPLEVTHRKLAADLGVPRGTVDTCLRAAMRVGIPSHG